MLLAAMAIASPRAQAEPAPTDPIREPSAPGLPGDHDPLSPGENGGLHVRLALIFFPPAAPPLDAPVVRAAPSGSGAPAPPAELSDYVNESFYALLSTRLVKNELSARSRRSVDAFRAARDDLRNELQRELARVRAADAGTRQRALEALARQQAPRLAALEQTAEALRQDLVDTYYGWFAQREWHLGEAGPRGDSPDEVAAVMRANAFFSIGLLPAQRGLLREVSMELAAAGKRAATAAAAQPWLFFSPETARVEFPDDLPEPLATRVAQYQTRKSGLKKQLYDAVYEQETAVFFHANIFKALARDQAAGLAELDQLAEEIRRGLAALPNPVRPAALSPLPPVLTNRVADLLRNRTALQAEAAAKVEEINRQLQPPDALVVLTYRFDDTGLTFEVRPARKNQKNVPRGVQREIERKIEEVSRAVAAVADAYGRDFVPLANEMSALRDDIAHALVAAGNPTPEAALAAAIRYADFEESAGAYRGYRTAVFEPGLSPEQRRLLFGQAVGELHLPLPAGERQPRFRQP
jgi:hypothetical protein